MRLVVLCVFLAGSVTLAEAGQRTRQPRTNSTPDTTSASGGAAEAYDQYLRGRLLEREENIDGAIAAFKRAAALDPTAGDVLAELSALYMRQNRVAEAMTTAEQALKVSPDSVEAHRVLGTVYAALSDTDIRASRGQQPQPAGQATENATKAIDHLEQALRRPGEPDPNVRANLARMYIRLKSYDKAIPLLRDLVTRERGWPEGVTLLTDAYTAAGKTAEAIAWLEEAAPDDPRLYATLADFYERERRWQDAAGAYAIAVQHTPRNNVDLKLRYASALLNSGGRESIGRARDLLADLVSSRPTDQRAMYLLSQSQRRSGDSSAAEATARRLIALNKQSPWGYYALAEALQDRQQFQTVIDTLSPALKDLRSASNTQALALLLPHLGFAYEQLGAYDQAIAAFDEAHKIAPNDALVTSYLIQANLAGKKYAAANELAQAARAQNPDDVRLARLHAQALRQMGQPDRAVAVMQEIVQKQADKPVAYVALAQIYQEANRGAEAVKVLDEARSKFPADISIAFELGAVLEKQKRYADAEAAFRQVLTRDPDNAPTLNYLGYMLADRGERLDESVGYLKKALQIDPENGSYLDSLGWAYFKSNKFDLAADNLQRAAGQLKTNSVIQDHYGEVLFKLGRFDEAIDAWTRALAGDGDSIDRGEIDKKIRTAQQKLKK